MANEAVSQNRDRRPRSENFQSAAAGGRGLSVAAQQDVYMVELT